MYRYKQCLPLPDDLGRLKSSNKRAPRAGRRGLALEPLEPRLLLSADPIAEAGRLALSDGVEGLSEWADRFAEISQLAESLPMVAAISDTEAAPGLADVLQLADIIQDQLFDPLTGYFAGADPASWNSADLAAALGASDLSVPEQLFFQLDLTDSRSASHDLDVAPLAERLGLSVAGDIALDVEGGVDVDLGFGVDLTPGLSPEDAFFIRLGDFTVSADVHSALPAFDATLGFLEVAVGAGNLDLDVDFGLTLGNPDGDPEGNLTLSELFGSSIAGLVTPTLAVATVDVELPLQASLGSFDESATFNLSGDPFDPSSFSIDFDDPDAADFLNFTQVTPQSFLSAFSHVASWLSSLTSNDLLATELPLTDGITIGDVLDFGSALEGGLIAPLTGTPEVHDVPSFSGAMEFAEQLAALLGVDISAINPDYDALADELSYHIEIAGAWEAVPGNLDFDFDLGQLGGLETSSALSFTASGGVAFTVAFDLSSFEAQLVATAPAASPELLENAVFELAVGRNEAVEVTLLASATTGNGSLAELIVDLNDAFADAGLSGVTASLSSDPATLDHIVLQAGGATGASLVLTADPASPAVTVLHLADEQPRHAASIIGDTPIEPTGVLDTAATFTIRANGGAPVLVTLPATAPGGGERSARDLVDELDAILLAMRTGPGAVLDTLVQADLSGTRLRLTSTDSGGDASIEIVSADAVAQSELGLPAAAAEGGTWARSLAGDALTDRISLDDIALTADVALEALDIDALARLGFIDVGIEDGSATGSAAVSLTQTGPDPISIGELFASFDELPTLFALTATATGDAVLPIVLDASIAGLALSTDPTANPRIELHFDVDLLDPAAATFDLQDYDLEELASFFDFSAIDPSELLSIENIIAGLVELLNFLEGLTDTPILSQEIPFMGKSLGELFSLGEELAGFISDFEANPAASLQALETQIEGVFGLSDPDLEIALVGGNDLRISLLLDTSASTTVPLALDLNDIVGGSLPDLISVGTEPDDELTATAGAGLTMVFGFDLSDPTSPRPYLHRDSEAALRLGVAATDLGAHASLGPFGVFLRNGTVLLEGPGTDNTATLGLSVDDTEELYYFDSLAFTGASSPFDFAVNGNAEVSVDVALSADPAADPVGSFGITIADIGDIAGTTTFTDTVDFDTLLADFEFADVAVEALLAGLQEFFENLENIFGNDVLGDVLPFIGDGLAKATAFLGNISDEITAALTGRSDAGDLALAAAEAALFEALGPAGLGLLNLPEDITLDDSDLSQGIKFNMHLDGDLLDPISLPIAFDVGIPGFGLSLGDPDNPDPEELRMEIGYDFDLGFGIDRTTGFYLDTSYAQELSLGFDIFASETLDLVGEIGFLTLTADLQAPDAYPAGWTPPAGDVQLFHGGIALNLLDPNSDDRLTLEELLAPTTDIEDVFGLGIFADAEVHLGLSADLSLGASLDQLFAVFADFDLEWHWAEGFGGGFGGEGARPDGDDLSIALNDVQFGIGGFIGEIVGGIIEKIEIITGPIDPVIDALTAPIPVLSDLLGQPVTFLDLAAIFGEGAATAAEWIESIIEVLDLLEMLDFADGNAATINVGSLDFSLGRGDLSLPDFDLFDEDLDLFAGVGDLSDLADQFDTAGGGDFYAGVSSTSSGDSGFRFPIFDDPALIFQLLLGKDVPLIEYRMPRLEVAFEYRQSFPIIGPLVATIAGRVGAFVEVGFGYDTLGIRTLVENITDGTTPDFGEGLLDMLEGFYVTDWNLAGKDIMEAGIFAEIAAGAALDLGIASAGVEGGITATIGLNLHDVEEDGRMHLGEIIDRVAIGPLCIFDLEGTIEAFLRAWVKVLFFSDSFELARVTLLSFSVGCSSEPPELATLEPDGTLYLNIGERAAERLNGNTSDGDESFIVSKLSDDAVTVEAFGYSQNYGKLKEEDTTPAVQRIVAYAGEGDDYIELSSAILVPTTLYGGNGNDTLIAGGGDDTLRGDAGNDQLRGGSGNDTLDGGSAADTLAGDQGDDSILGGTGDDQIEGHIGDDFLSGGDDDDTILGDLGNDTILGGDGVDQLFGEEGRDSISGGAGTDLIQGGDEDDLAEGGGDTLEGGAGWDLIFGGGGSDLIYGHSASGVGDDGAADSIWGDYGSIFGPDEGIGDPALAGADVIYGGDGPDQIYAGDRDDTVYGGAGNDGIFGQNGDDVLHGGDDDDGLIGGPGQDTLLGELGNDRLRGDAGVDRLEGGDGADDLQGGLDDDVLLGGADDDTLRGQQGADLLYGGIETPIPGGDGNDALYGAEGNDTLLGGSGNDWLEGSFGVDSLSGEAGDDTLYGGTQDDILLGDAGRDLIFGNAGADAIMGGSEADTLWGNTGSDTIHGDAGDDEIHGDEDPDLLFGDADHDVVHGDAADDTLYGSTGDDFLYGHGGFDLIFGEQGDDHLQGNEDDDTLFAGDGADTLFGDDGVDELYGEAGPDILWGGDGSDVLLGADDPDVLHGDAGNDLLLGQAANDTLFGDAGDDALYGGDDADELRGGLGRDRLYGEAGDDLAYGGDDDDWIEGHDGADLLFGDAGDDHLSGGEGVDPYISGGLGNDTLLAGAGLGGQLSGDDGDDLLVGSDEGEDDANFGDTVYFGDRMLGGPGNDTLLGLGGADVLNGGVGDDRIEGGAHGDYIVGDAGDDIIFAGLGADYVVAGVGFDIVDGGAGGDQLWGGTDDDEIHGGGGADTIGGEGGDDTLYGSDDAADLILGGPGDDRIFGYGGNDELQGDDGDDVVEGGFGDDSIEGGAGSDLLVGGADHDVLYGHTFTGTGDDAAIDRLFGDFGSDGDEASSGRDQLFGGLGSDVLYGEGEDDLIVGGGLADTIGYGSGESGVPGDFVAPTPTPAPALGNYENPRAVGSLPDGIEPSGRWVGLAGSALGAGLASGDAPAIEPAIVSGPGGTVVAWADARNESFEIYVARYAGGVWEMFGGSAERGGVSDTSAASLRPSVALDAAGLPIVAWTEVAEGSGGSDIRVAKWDPAAAAGAGAWVALGSSLDAGGVSGSGIADDAVLLFASGAPTLAWIEQTGGVSTIQAKRFDGASWVDLGASAIPLGSGVRDLAMAAEGSELAIAWSQQDAGGVQNVYVRSYVGASWVETAGSGSGSGVSGAAYDAVAPSIAIHGGELFVAWQQAQASNLFASEIYAAHLSGGSWLAAGAGALAPGGVSQSEGVALRPELSSGGGELHLFWLDDALRDRPESGVAVYATRWTGSAFVEELRGDATDRGISSNGGSLTDLAVATDASGHPFVAWSDADASASTLRVRANLFEAGTVYTADGVTSVQDILDANPLAPGDVILVAPGASVGGFTVTASDAGILILGARDGSSIVSGDVTLDAASGVVLQSLVVQGDVNVVASDGAALHENTIEGGVRITGASGVALVENQVVGEEPAAGATLRIEGASTGLGIAHNRFQGANVIWVADGSAASGFIESNDVVATSVGLHVGASFGGVIRGNDILGNGESSGLWYAAPAVLHDNRIHGHDDGVVVLPSAEADGFGFTGTPQAGPLGALHANEIFDNVAGVDLEAGSWIQGQYIHDNEVGITNVGTVGGRSLDFANRIEANGIGVSVTGEIRFNRIANNGIGIEAHPDQLIVHNLIYRNETAGIKASAVSDVRIVNNTLYAPSGDAIRVVDGSSEVEVRSNILWAESGYDLYVANDSRTGFFSDYNLLHTSGSGKLGYWTRDFGDILDWQADVARFDLHSIGVTVVNPLWSEPGFANRAHDDYRISGLSAGQRLASPSIDAGDPRADLGQPALYQNLLANPGFEGGTAGWTTNIGAGIQSVAPEAWEGADYFDAGDIEEGRAEQTVDLVAAGFLAGDLDNQSLDVVFGGRIRSEAETTVDGGSIVLTFLDAGGGTLGERTVVSSDPTDRWDLVGERINLPAGTRQISYSFRADRSTGASNDSHLDAAFLHLLDEAAAPNQGAYGNHASETPSPEAHIALRFPDLYTDWELDRPLTIQWDAYGSVGSPIRIDLYQDGPDGPALATNLAAATPNDGEFVWIPSTAGLTHGTHGLRIHVALADRAAVYDRSTETFSVPESGDDYFVNIGGDVDFADNEHTSAAGSNRNTGKTPASPKPNPVNVARVYELSAGAELFVDTGAYAMIDALRLSGSSDRGLGLDEGFTITGPVDPAHVAHLSPSAPEDLFPGLIELDDADFMTISGLTLSAAERGLWSHAGSDNTTLTRLTAFGHTEEGFRVEGESPFSTFAGLTAYGNQEDGIYIDGRLEALTGALVHDNDGYGLRLIDTGARVETSDVYANSTGIYVTNGTAIPPVMIGNADLSLGLGNIVHGNALRGIQTGARTTVAGNTIFGHESTSYGEGIYLGSTESQALHNVLYANDVGIYVSSADAIVEGNRAFGNVDAGIEVARAARISRNVLYSNGVGIDVPTSSGSFAGRLENNLVYANVLAAIRLTRDDTVVVNNTIYQPNGDGIVLTSTAQDITLRNNIIEVASGYGITIDNNSQAGFTSEFNLFHTTGAGQVGLWQGVGRSDLVAWQNASFGDAQSLFADPQFVGALGGDGQLGYDYGSQTDHGSDDDFHLQSLYGSFHGGALAPTIDPGTGLPLFAVASETSDGNQSPAIDRGDDSPAFSAPLANEPGPNGGYVNLGAYGGTEQASKSPSQYLLLITPDGGERIPQESTVPIRWRSDGFAGDVKIEYSTVGLGGPFQTLSGNEANDDLFDWYVDPALFPTADDAYAIRITSVAEPAVAAVSQAVFSVSPPISLFYVNVAGDADFSDNEYTTAAGDDAQDGLTPSSPKASIRALLEAYDLGEGDIVYVDSGLYSVTTNIVVGEGDSGVSIQGPVGVGHSAVLDRGNTATSSHVFELQGVDDLLLDSLEITGGYSGVYAAAGSESDRLTVSNSDIHGNYRHGIWLQSSNDAAQILGNQVYGQGSSGYGIWLEAPGHVEANEVYGNANYGIRATGSTILSNDVHDNSTGIYLEGGRAEDNDIHGNTTYGLYAVGTAGEVVGNRIYGQAGSGDIGLYMAGTNNRAWGNESYANAVGVLLASSSAQLESNRIFGNTAAGVRVSSFGSLAENAIYSNEVGIDVTSSSGALDARIENNVIYDSGTASIVLRRDDTVVANNTIHEPLADGIVLTSSAQDISLRNNIFSLGAGIAITVSDDSQEGFASDYNLFDLTGGARLANWEGLDFATRVDWLYEIGFDQHSRSLEPADGPLFISPNGPDGLLGYEPAGGLDSGLDDDFHVQPGSPGIDAGDPHSLHQREPVPNGGRVNVGAYGNTPEAALSPAQQIQVLWPNGFDKFEVGETVDVTWLTSGLLDEAVVALINSGGEDASATGAGFWSADRYRADGNSYAISAAVDISGITTPGPQEIYQSHALGTSGVGESLSYGIPLPDGAYDVVLHFVEPTYGTAGTRVFDVVLQGAVAEAGLDVGGEAGLRVALGREYAVTVVGGEGLRIDLVNQTSIAAVLSAIEVRRANAGGESSVSVDVDFSGDLGGAWSEIAAALPLDEFGGGSMQWVAGPETGGNTGKIRVESNGGSPATGESDGGFLIANAGTSYYVNIAGDTDFSDNEYTAAAGDNANSGKSADAPMASLGALLRVYEVGTDDIVYVDTGSYTIATNIVLDESASGVRIQGPVVAPHSALLDRGNTAAGIYVFELTGADDVVLDSLTITGAYEGIHAETNLGSDRLTVSNSEIHGNQRYGINIKAGNLDTQILDNQVYGQISSGYGIVLDAAGRIEGNVVFGNASYGIDANDSLILANEVYGNGTGIGAAGGRVEDNDAYANTNNGIYATGTGTEVTGNRVHGHSGGADIGIYAAGTDGRTWDNEVYANAIGIRLAGASTSVESNRVYANTTGGIVVSVGLRVAGNQIYSNTVGVDVTASSGSFPGRIENNVIYDSGTAGIILRRDDTIVENNTLYEPTADGIVLESSAQDVSLRNNIFSLAAGAAISVSDDSQSGFVSDYNLFDLTGAASIAIWEGASFTTRVDWAYEVGFDGHSLEGAPSYTSASGVDGLLGWDSGSEVDNGVDDDFHLLLGSLGVDAGDPHSYYFQEPLPNGRRINIGAYGNTPEAASSPARQVQVLSPDGWEKFEAGESVEVAWMTSGLLDEAVVALINAGGGEASAPGAGFWSAEGYRTSDQYGGTILDPVDISGLVAPGPQEVFQSYASTPGGVGYSLDYQLPVVDGDYELKLHFVEPTYSTTGLRAFDVVLQGELAEAGVDVFDEVGLRTALSREYLVSVSGGEGLQIELVNLSSFGVALMGIEVRRSNPAGEAAVTVGVEFSGDLGGVWSPVATGLPVDAFGNGSMQWIAGPETSGNTGLIRVESDTAAPVSGESAEGFLITNAGTSYYVNIAGDVDLSDNEYTTAAGDNTNSGKRPDAPMASLAALLRGYDVDPGDVIYVDTGVYTVPVNIVLGEDASGVRIQGPQDAGHEALLDRGNTATTSFLFDLAGADDVVFDSLSITGAYAGINADYQADSDGIVVSNSEIFANQTYGIQLSVGNDGARILNNRVHDQISNGRGIYLDEPGHVEGNVVFGNSNTGIDTDDSVVIGNEVYGNGTGIYTYGGRIEANDVHDNVAYGIQDTGIGGQIVGNLVYGQSEANDVGIHLGGSGSVAWDNDVHSNTTGIRSWSSTATIEGNRVYANSQFGISVTGTGAIRGNSIYSNAVGIDVPVGSGALVARIENNLLYSNTNSGIVLRRDDTMVINNTIYQSVGTGIELTSSAQDVSLRNNVLWADAGFLLSVSTDSQPGFVSDYNLFYRGPGDGASTAVWGGAPLTTLADWQAATAGDANSRVGDPLPIDIDGADNVLGEQGVEEGGGDDDNFGLRANSPAIDAADAYYSPILDIEGRTRRDDPDTPNAGIGWDLFVETGLGSSLFTAGGTAQGWRSGTGYWTLSLPFDFPFYGKEYGSVKVAANGYLQFEGPDWAGSSDNTLSELQQNVRIAPLWDDINTYGTGDDVFVDTATPGEITIRWAGRHDQTGGDVDFSVTLFDDGTFRFDYGAGSNQGLTPTVGVSAGNGFSFVVSSYDGSSSLDGADSLGWAPEPGLVYFDIGAYEFQGNSSDLVPPQVTGVSTLPAEGGSTDWAFTSVAIGFSEPLDGISARSPANYELLGAGVDGIFGNTDDFLVPLYPAYSFPETNLVLELTDGPLADGDYRLTLSGTRAIFDSAGNPLDGNADGTGGDDFVRNFTIDRSLNDPPTADPQAVGVDEDETLTITLVGDDPNDDALAYSILTPPQHGSLGGIDPTTHEVVYTPDLHYHGPDAFSFQVDDGKLGTASATVTIDVDPVNDAPEALDLIVDAFEDVPILIQLPVSDVETPLALLGFELVSGPDHGTLAQGPAGAWTYTPDAEYFGPDEFAYRVTDGGDPDGTPGNVLTSVDAFVTIDVASVNDAPVLTPIPPLQVEQGEELRFTATATDVDGGPGELYFYLQSAVSGSSINWTTGEFSWTPAPDLAPGVYSVTVVVGDQGSPSLVDQQVVEITVTEPAPPLMGDANDDCVVDGADYTVWADNYGQTEVGFYGGDFNTDGIVNGADYTLWADNYAATCDGGGGGAAASTFAMVTGGTATFAASAADVREGDPVSVAELLAPTPVSTLLSSSQPWLAAHRIESSHTFSYAVRVLASEWNSSLNDGDEEEAGGLARAVARAREIDLQGGDESGGGFDYREITRSRAELRASDAPATLGSEGASEVSGHGPRRRPRWSSRSGD